MKKLFLIPVLLLGMFLNCNNVAAQVMDDIYVPDHIPNRKPIPYKYLREADAMYKKRVWRVIDLREKINLNLYYPTTKINERMSLIDLLLMGINNEGLTAYNTDDDRFTQPMGRILALLRRRLLIPMRMVTNKHRALKVTSTVLR